MIPVETLSIFFAASLLLAIAPGPDNIFVLTQSAMYGRTSGFFITLGLCTGLIVHTTAVAFGIAVIFQTSALAFTVLKIAGACYLLYLAWQAFRVKTIKAGSGENNRLGFGKLYRRGIIMNVTNPKVSVFFLAFLPQFADPARGSLTFQLILLGAIFIIATMLIFGAVAILAGSIGQWIGRSEKAQLIMNRLTAAIFVALALKLALTER
jgi:threonine/homoserine/homoserine lactone efflux protein